MADIFTKAKRSDVMSRIRGSGNKETELKLMAIFRLHSITGWRRGASLQFKTDEMKFKVRPDFVFRDRTLAVFVDGCFWHGCPLHATQPKSNAKFWREKIARNQARDVLVTRTLRRVGWRVLRIWEHELTKSNGRHLLARFRRYGLMTG